MLPGRGIVRAFAGLRTDGSDGERSSGLRERNRDRVYSMWPCNIDSVQPHIIK
jgi:hypothetical protein